jgi:PadR family transcriptional regulator PadR
MNEIDSTLKRGSAELAVLSLLESGPLHGYEIGKQIEQRTGGVLRFDVASLYPLLYRLEKDGLVKARWQQAESGRRRRYYELTSAGRKRLGPLRQQWKSFFVALDQLSGLQNA